MAASDAPMHTRIWVLKPAGRLLEERSRSITAPQKHAMSNLKSVGQKLRPLTCWWEAHS